MAQPWILSIDFGTSYTLVAAKVGDRTPEVVEIGGERRMPSVVLVESNGNVVVGRTADDLAGANPANTLRAPKNRLGDQAPVVLGGRPYQTVQLVAALLRNVYDEAVGQMGEPPTEVRLTHPAVWNRPRLNRLLEAAAKAGLPNPALVPEPVAAALSYASEAGVPEGNHLVVYDLGGGTFDTAVVTARRGGFVVEGRPGGDQNIGGELFDELVMNHIGEQLDPEDWEQIQVADDPTWQQVGASLRKEARRAKETLSSHPYADLLLPLPDGLVQRRITRDEFEQIVGPYIDETVVLLRRCITDAGVDESTVSSIYLVGGASRSPIVERLVKAAFPDVMVSRRGDPKTSVALGAARAVRSGGTPATSSQRTQEASPNTADEPLAFGLPSGEPQVAPTPSQPSQPSQPGQPTRPGQSSHPSQPTPPGQPSDPGMAAPPRPAAGASGSGGPAPTGPAPTGLPGTSSHPSQPTAVGAAPSFGPGVVGAPGTSGAPGSAPPAPGSTAPTYTGAPAPAYGGQPPYGSSGSQPLSLVGAGAAGGGGSSGSRFGGKTIAMIGAAAVVVGALVGFIVLKASGGGGGSADTTERSRRTTTTTDDVPETTAPVDTTLPSVDALTGLLTTTDELTTTFGGAATWTEIDGLDPTFQGDTFCDFTAPTKPAQSALRGFSSSDSSEVYTRIDQFEDSDAALRALGHDQTIAASCTGEHPYTIAGVDYTATLLDVSASLGQILGPDSAAVGFVLTPPADRTDLQQVGGYILEWRRGAHVVSAELDTYGRVPASDESTQFGALATALFVRSASLG